MEQRTKLYDLGAERAVLGALLLNFKLSNLDKIEKLLTADSFYHNAHVLIFSAIRNVVNRGGNVDTVTLAHDLREAGQLEQVGGAVYLSELPGVAPIAGSITYYGQIVQNYAIRRHLQETAQNMVEQAFNETLQVDAIIQSVEERIFQIDQERKVFAYRDARELIRTTLDILEKRNLSKNRFTGLESKFDELDEMLSGLQASEMIVIGARPSMGKTALALSMAENIAVKQKIATGFFTLEMPAEQLMMRLLASEAQINGKKLRNPSLMSTSDWSKLSDAASRIYDAPLYIDDTPSMSLTALRSQARRMKMEKDIQVLFIDYLGLITVNDRALPRHEQMSLVSRNIKALARELSIPVVILSQLRRDAEGKEPNLADLRETGAIEQDADVVMFLHRDRLHTDEADDGIIETKLIVAKQRNGPIGVTNLAFIPRFARFTNLSKG